MILELCNQYGNKLIFRKENCIDLIKSNYSLAKEMLDPIFEESYIIADKPISDTGIVKINRNFTGLLNYLGGFDNS